MTKQSHIQYQKSTISYHIIGEGSRLAIAFHGYGESASHFDYLDQMARENQTTLLAIDLPFHGKTVWNEGLNCTTQDLKSIIHQILIQENKDQKQRFELWGYSMGGRIALGFYQDYPEMIQKLVLVAPDGIYVNPWYWLSTQTKLGNIIFNKTMNKPTWFLKILDAGYKLKLINKSIYKFATTYVDDAEVRAALYTRWTCFRNIYPRKQAIMQRIKQYHTPIIGIYGAFDRIIPYHRVEKFWNQIYSHQRVFHINDGHKLLQLKYAAYLWKD